MVKQQQGGWKELLGRFDAGGGTILDIEFLTNDKGAFCARPFPSVSLHLSVDSGIPLAEAELWEYHATYSITSKIAI